MTLVAVYGTLKRNHVNYRRLLDDETPVFCDFVVLPYAMYRNDEYPMLVPSDSRNRILIEVFDVDDAKLSELDALEAPYGYWRERIFLAELGRDVEIYLHPAPAPAGFTFVASGDWDG